MNLKIAILPGDGIGPEIMQQGVAVLPLPTSSTTSSNTKKPSAVPMP